MRNRTEKKEKFNMREKFNEILKNHGIYEEIEI